MLYSNVADLKAQECRVDKNRLQVNEPPSVILFEAAVVVKWEKFSV